VQLQEALEVLGVLPTTPWPDVRIAYRDRIRRLHPDVAGPGSGAHAARTNEAFRVVRAAVADGSHPAPAPAPAPVAWPAEAVEVAVLDDEGLELVAPPDEVFDRLHAALHAVGQVTYVDPGGGLLECLLETEGHPPSQLTVSLQGRGATTEAFFTLESLDARAAPPLPAVVRLLAQRLREMPLP
jgi:hypothetical protein